MEFRGMKSIVLPIRAMKTRLMAAEDYFWSNGRSKGVTRICCHFGLPHSGGCKDLA